MNTSIVRPRRSFIFAPGLRPEMFPKALASGTDIVCVELEDGIAPKDKGEARKHALGLFETPQADDGVERIVRINCLREKFGIEDVQAILATDTPPPALMMPKVRTPDEVVMLDNLLSERGHDTRLHIIIETNAGLEAAYEIAHCSSRIDALFFGGVDMAAELRCDNAWEPLLYARSRVVHAAASAAGSM
jgi:(S)-citramalyl-CoA lyase